jgi:hypothetical protein
VIGDDTSTAKRITDSIKVYETEESYRGASEVSLDMDEEEMNACTKYHGPLY